MSEDREGGSIEMEAFLIYRAAYRIVSDALDEGSDRTRIGRRIPLAVDEYVKRRGWDRSPEAMELVRQGVEDAMEGRQPAY